MLKLLLFFAILQSIDCSCPEGLELVRDGECRGYYGRISIRDDQATDTAISKCNELHAQPLIIHNEEQQSYWTNKYADVSLLLGLVCNSTSKRYEWSDGSTLDYKPPNNYYNGLDKECSAGHSWMMFRNTGEWTYYGPDGNSVVNQFDVYCVTPLPPQPVASADGCESFEDDAEDGVCYQVGDVAENWQDAQMICQKLGANLASIHNSQENSIIRRLAVSRGAVNGVYLGATIAGKGKDFGWIDGTDWDYQNFHQGFPMAGFGDCIAMDTSISTGLWMNMDCTAKLPVACIRQQKEVTEPTCSAGPWKEGTIITSPGFPYSASTFCDYFLTVEAGKKVELEIIFLEANSCCDSLVIYDGYLGSNVIATLSGALSNVTYTTTDSNIMRVNWQPNGGVNVMGVAMTFRGV